MTTGRNDPCPCGSGRKYKKCHLAADSAPREAARLDTPSSLHALDNRIVQDIVDFMARRFPNELDDETEILESHPLMDIQFAGHWLAWIAHFEGRPAVEWYLENAGWSLSRGATEWIAAQREAWLSIWQVVEVERGQSLVLRDLLTGEQRTVHEIEGSRAIDVNLLLLCRIVDHAGVSTMCGVHPQPLRPGQGLMVIERMKKALRRKTAVPPERLRELRIARRLLEEWSTAIDSLSIPPTLVNNDGDPILQTSDRWRIDAGSRDAIATVIESMEGSVAEGKGEFAIVRESDSTMIGFIRLAGSAMVLETNSIARADLLRDRVETACAGLLGPHVRSHSDPTARFQEADSTETDDSMLPPEPAATAEENAVIRAMKERHYAAWLDEPLPALDGKTPRETARTATGRERVKLLLQGIEDIERDVEEEARFDVSRLWRELELKRKVSESEHTVRKRTPGDS